MSKQGYRLPRAKTPEEVGVSSMEFLEFLEDMQQNCKEVHSMMVVRHGQVAIEFYRHPFGPDSPHTMYSVSKSWTATAVGLAVDEGFFSLDDKVIDFFPEHRPSQPDAKLEKLLVRHLLTMSSGKNVSVLEDKSKGKWLDAYFASPWSFEPGKGYLYISENTFVLSAILRKTTGKGVREFLRPRVFEPLNIEVPFWEEDENQVEAGGWGLYIKTEDLAKIMLCYHNGGKLNGRQILPKWWVEEAVLPHSDNSDNNNIDSTGGYGYSFWRCVTYPGGYRMDGMFSQYGIVLPDHDAVIAFTSAVPDQQSALDLIWRHFPKAFFEPEAGAYYQTAENFSDRLSGYPIDIPRTSFHGTREESLRGKTMTFNRNLLLNAVGFPLSVLPLAVTYMTSDKAGNIDHVQLAFQDNYVKMRWTEGDEVNTIRIATDGTLAYDQVRLGQIDYPVCSYGYWESEDVFVAHIRPYTTIGMRILRFAFHGEDRVVLNPCSTPPVQDILDNLGAIAGDIIKSELLLKAVPPALQVAGRLVEPKFHGRLV